MNRKALADQTEKVGQDVFALRAELLSGDAPFCAGLARAAEEALLVVMAALRDGAVSDVDL